MRRAAILSVLALLALGCAETADQNTFIVRVSTINRGNPLLADVIRCENDTTCGVPVDVVLTEFTNRVYSPSVVTDPSVFWYDFHLKGYTVTWRRADRGPTSGPGWTLAEFNHSQATSAIVPVNGSAEVGVLVVPVAMKSAVPFVNLIAGGEIALIADIDFVGSPAIDPEDQIHVRASLSVSFANFLDD